MNTNAVEAGTTRDRFPRTFQIGARLLGVVYWISQNLSDRAGRSAGNVYGQYHSRSRERTPCRAYHLCTWVFKAPTAATTSSPARTALSASSSWAWG
jgi:hypothetical protein